MHEKSVLLTQASIKGKATRDNRPPQAVVRETPLLLEALVEAVVAVVVVGEVVALPDDETAFSTMPSVEVEAV